MRRKLWPKAPVEEAKEAKDVKKFSSLLYTYKFFQETKQQNLQYCDVTIFVF